MRPIPMINVVVVLLALAGCSNDAPTEFPAAEVPASDVPASETLSPDDLVASSVETESVKKMMKRYNGQVKTCYEDGLEANADLAGKVTVSFQIATTGAVSEATSPENTTGDETLASCVLDIIRAMKMTPPPAEVVAVAGYPYLFSTR